MPTGPKGEKRPADVIGDVVKVMRIATGENEEETTPKSGRVRSGHAGTRARADNLSSDERRTIAKKAAATGWKKD